MWLEGLGELKRFNDLIKIRTCNLPACSIVPQPSTLPLPLIQWVPGAFPAGVKRQGREADHSSPTSVEVKKM
jgi:hypothetical protein